MEDPKGLFQSMQYLIKTFHIKTKSVNLCEKICRDIGTRKTFRVGLLGPITDSVKLVF